ncbi:hypothetical protein SMACR_00063 [Sordaria macrospora]|uniref:WGS project CABT00000000 data, contig 2.1 n=2 Tax=Sordaria macrospora TaxID=5147 RepID=F7VK20_SORMK|nr:uncharacterized protein SMAC_00063 [Sordaria macrospora k-hell]KAA8623974.1 hypothetical protein SMACR_00063 [Sordaria macrospora]WPJ62838.1 hypothetical protein SMAC4_00063 [Sordaria macrospora]CCC05847.1 unnamed protein product [Sordaria macrospora k-hell]
MDISNDEPGATETALSTGPVRGTKRQHDDSDQDNAIDDSQIYKRQRINDETTIVGIWGLNNLDDPANFFTANLDTAEPNRDHRTLINEEREMLLALGFQLDDDPGPETNVPNSESYDGEANPTAVPLDPATEYTNPADPNHIGEWEYQDWMSMSFEDLFANPAWDYPQDPLLGLQPYDPAPWLLDENLPISSEPDAPTVELQAEDIGVVKGFGEQFLNPNGTSEARIEDAQQTEHTGGLDLLDEHLCNSDVTFEVNVENVGQIEHTNGLEVLDENLFSPDTTSDSLFTGGQTTEPTFLSSPDCAAHGLGDCHPPPPEQIFGQTGYSNAVFEPDLWQLAAAPNKVGTGELHDDKPASNYPFEHLESSAAQDGDETQVKE